MSAWTQSPLPTPPLPAGPVGSRAGVVREKVGGVEGGKCTVGMGSTPPSISPIRKAQIKGRLDVATELKWAFSSGAPVIEAK